MRSADEDAAPLTLARLLDPIGVGVFAIGGALAARRTRLFEVGEE